LIIPYVSILVGILLCVLTAVGVTEAESNQLETTFIPMLVGVPLFVGGAIALDPGRRRQALLGSAIVSLLGMIAWGCVFTHLLQLAPSLTSHDEHILVQFVAHCMGALCFIYLFSWLGQKLSARRSASTSRG
jgi:ascorbate-specific PTS system EIIC-type component UlaA